MPINHVPEEDRYQLTKARSIPGAVLHLLSDYTTDVLCPGFYGVMYMTGFRDKFNVDIDTILNLICSYIQPAFYFAPSQCTPSLVGMETSIDPYASQETIDELRHAAGYPTHLFVYL